MAAVFETLSEDAFHFASDLAVTGLECLHGKDFQSGYRYPVGNTEISVTGPARILRRDSRKARQPVGQPESYERLTIMYILGAVKLRSFYKPILAFSN